MSPLFTSDLFQLLKTQVIFVSSSESRNSKVFKMAHSSDSESASGSSSSSSDDSRRSDRGYRRSGRDSRRSGAGASRETKEGTDDRRRTRSPTPQPQQPPQPQPQPQDGEFDLFDPEDVPIAPPRKRSRGETDDSTSRKFSVSRSRSKKFRKAMSSCLPPSDARMIRKYYEPKFLKRSVSLHCPKIDHSMVRRMKEKKGPELTKVEQKEKALTSMQFKLLDIARPLLFVSESLAADKTDANLDVQDPCSDSIRLLGHAFASITAKRREYILKFTDPRFESLLKEPERFDLDESDELFGRSFLRSMVQDADNDAKLRIVNRASNSVQRQSGHSGPSGSSHHHGRKGGRHSASSNFPSGSNRGGFNNNFSGKGYVNPSTSLFCDLGYVGGRVRFDADFWPTLTNDQWVIRSVSEGVRIPYENESLKIPA